MATVVIMSRLTYFPLASVLFSFWLFILSLSFPPLLWWLLLFLWSLVLPASLLAAHVLAFCQSLGSIVCVPYPKGWGKFGKLLQLRKGWDGQNKQVPKPESTQLSRAVSLLSVDHQLVEILRPSRSSSVRLDKLSSPTLSVRLISFKRD